MTRQFSVTQVVGTASATVLAALAIFVGTWLWQNIVFAGDLDVAIKTAIEPVTAQVSAVNDKVIANTALLTRSIRNGLRADIRDLRKEIQDMEQQQEHAPDTWTAVHEALLDEWIEEQEQLEDQLDELNND